MPISSTDPAAVRALLEWYQAKARPFLEKMQPEKVTDFDADVERVKKAQAKLQKELTVCFLGNSGVGKSTLINALVAGNEIILPSGGIGPLTAQALVVGYSEKKRFVVKYHTPKNLWKLTFALDRSLQAERKRAEQKEGLPAPDDLSMGVEDEDRKEIETAIVEGGAQRSKIEEYKKQALLMIVGDQDGQAELPYLVDCLRTVLGKERIWGTSIRPEDESRIRYLQTILEKANDDTPRSMSAENPAFKKMLHSHASGFLAPMIEKLTVFWDSPILRAGLALVDLPGLGIANDVYQAVTSEWVRERAEAIVLVVEVRGVTEVNAELLRTSGFLNRLLHASDDPTADPVELMVAVVKGDVIADERYAQERDKNQKKKRDHLADVTEASIRHIKDHLRPQLAKVWTSESEQVGQAQKVVIDRIIEKLEVHPVSAVQFRKLVAGDEEDRAFITNPGQSGIPQLLESLERLAQSRRAEQQARLGIITNEFVHRLLSGVRLDQARWQEDNRANEEAEKLRGELNSFLEPLRKEFNVRQGAFREFLRNTLPQRIEALVLSATVTANKDIVKYLRTTLDDAHYQTLRAAVQRGGTFHGAKKIDLPLDFALRFEEPIAAVWGKQILKEIRGRTKEFGDDCVRLVEKIVDWAKSQGARVQPQVLLAQCDEIKADAKKLEAVGREMVNELRDDVKNRLAKEIEGPIRKRCRRFIEKEEHCGKGATERIRSFFKELADEATESAIKPTNEILVSCFRDVENEILSVFEHYQDPITAAAEAIVASHEQRTKRSDAQRRKKVLAEAAEVLGACPWKSDDEAVTDLPNSPKGPYQ